jgi:V/A-type H+-transporting ATPase subunit E
MSGLETMIKTILDEANAEAQAVLDQAHRAAGRLLAEAKVQTDGDCERIVEQGRGRAEALRARAEAAAGMERRRALLEKKQELLNRAVQTAWEAILALPEDEYFGLLIRLAQESSEPRHGVMLLSGRDLERCPAGFHVELNRVLPDGASLDIASSARPIEGGFVLKYGDIEQNCSLSAIFDANREKILDAAQDALFR